MPRRDSFSLRIESLKRLIFFIRRSLLLVLREGDQQDVRHGLHRAVPQRREHVRRCQQGGRGIRVQVRDRVRMRVRITSTGEGYENDTNTDQG